MSVLGLAPLALSLRGRSAPSPFQLPFGAVTDAAPGATAESQVVTVSPLTAGTPVAFLSGAPAGAEFRILSSTDQVLRDWSADAATMNDGENVQLRLVTAATGLTTVSAFLSVGGVIGGFSATTAFVPTAPANVTSFAVDPAGSLDWVFNADDGGSPLTSVTIERRIGGGAFEPIFEASTPPALPTSFVDDSRPTGISVSYRITVANAVGGSGYGAPETVVFAPTIAAFGVEPTGRVFWDLGPMRAQSVLVERDDDGAGFVAVFSDPAPLSGAADFQDSGYPRDVTVRYRLTATPIDGAPIASNIAEIVYPDAASPPALPTISSWKGMHDDNAANLAAWAATPIQLDDAVRIEGDSLSHGDFG
ncbi:MAG: hypothetical protein AAFU55_09340, partial [Pseudomonadota bacterium]